MSPSLLLVAIHATVLLTLSATSTVAQTTWYVDDDACPGPGSGTEADPFCKIQDGIDAAAHGDTVLVMPGTYFENIDFLGKAITVKGRDGASTTVIDGQQLGSVVSFVSRETRQAVLWGFTVTNGSGTHVGANTFGGGIFCDASSPTIVCNQIIKNTTVEVAGMGYGCGICLDHESSPLIVSNRIDGNRYGNSVSIGGGVGALNGSNGVLASNTISFNDTNTRSGEGGGLFASGSALLVVNGTIAGNRARQGSGLSAGSTTIVFNSIVWNNIGDGGTLDRQVIGNPEIHFSDIQRGWSTGFGNIDVDPQFVELSVNDLHLLHDSPCIDAGWPFVPELPSADFEGDPRIAFGLPDMGADEFHRHLYVKGNTVRGGLVSARMIGLPRSEPVALLIGSGVYDPPVSSKLGDWYLQSPVFTFPLLPIPDDGLEVVFFLLPDDIPGPYSVPMQSVIGGWLTNLAVLDVQ